MNVTTMVVYLKAPGK